MLITTESEMHAQQRLHPHPNPAFKSQAVTLGRPACSDAMPGCTGSRRNLQTASTLGAGSTSQAYDQNVGTFTANRADDHNCVRRNAGYILYGKSVPVCQLSDSELASVSPGAWIPVSTSTV